MCEILVEPDSCSVVTDDLFITVVMYLCFGQVLNMYDATLFCNVTHICV